MNGSARAQCLSHELLLFAAGIFAVKVYHYVWLSVICDSCGFSVILSQPRNGDSNPGTIKIM